MISCVISFCAVLLYMCITVTSKRNCTTVSCLKSLSKRTSAEERDDVNFAAPIPIEEYISQKGYPVEDHVIQTEDGYLLTYHRIPHGKSASANTTPGRPVLLQHGLLVGSPVWVMADHSLGYSLADAGFDVWLGNARGNTYSRKHVKYDPDRDKKEFWDFSWHEMGYYDLPASIDYILNTTSRDQLFYIGHSMGTTMYFVLGATRPEYMDKVQAAALLAPVAFPWNVRSPIVNFIYDFNLFLYWGTRALGWYELPSISDSWLQWLTHHSCDHQRTQFLCRDFIFFIAGFDNQELNRTSLPTVLEYSPSGGSYKTIQHYNQIEKNGVPFQQFDYGRKGNLRRYGTPRPPVYNLTNARAPLCVYYSANDWLAVPQDVSYTLTQLANVQTVTRVPDDQFNHIDFMWAVDAKKLLYDVVIATLQSYE